VNDLDDLLTGGEALKNLRTNRPHSYFSIKSLTTLKLTWLLEAQVGLHAGRPDILFGHYT
jgi:hypothetical protein